MIVASNSGEQNNIGESECQALGAGASRAFVFSCGRPEGVDLDGDKVGVPCRIYKRYFGVGSSDYDGSLCRGCCWLNSEVSGGTPSLIKSGGVIATNRQGSLSIRNVITGAVAVFNVGGKFDRLYRFNRVVRGLDRLAEKYGLRVYFLTFTLDDSSVETVNRGLHRILTFMGTRFRRAGLLWYYLWVVELQKKRYRRYGVKALHWHFAIVAPGGSLPDVHYVKGGRKHYQVQAEGSVVSSSDLFDRWGHGQVLCGYAWSGIGGYLGKYLSKDCESLAGYKREWASLRRFGSSRLGFYGYSEDGYTWLTVLESSGVPVCELRVWKKGSVIHVGADDPVWVDVHLGYYIDTRVILYEHRSPWRVVGGEDDKVP